MYVLVEEYGSAAIVCIKFFPQILIGKEGMAIGGKQLPAHQFHHLRQGYVRINIYAHCCLKQEIAKAFQFIARPASFSGGKQYLASSSTTCHIRHVSQCHRPCHVEHLIHGDLFLLASCLGVQPVDDPDLLYKASFLVMLLDGEIRKTQTFSIAAHLVKPPLAVGIVSL